MRLINGTIVILFVVHVAVARPLEEDHQLTTTTHCNGHITGRADPVGPGTSSIPNSPKSATGTASPASQAGLNEAPKRFTLELVTDSTGCYVELDVGTPAMTFRLTLDTGSSDTWIVGSGEPDPEEEWYDPGASSSAQRIEGLNTVTIVYEGDLPGESTTFDMYTDTVTVDDLTIRNVPIGAAKTWSEQSLGIIGEGIFALGLPQLSRSGQKPIFNFLVDEGLVSEPCFSIRLIHPLWVDNMRETSILTLGGFDPMAMDGEFTDLEVHSDLYWLVLVDSIFIDGVPAAITTRLLAVIDTGSSVIAGSLDLVRKLHRAIPGSREEERPKRPNVRRFIIPCDSTVALTVVFAGQPFRVSADQLVGDQISETETEAFDCWSNVVASVNDNTVELFWIFGLPLLQSVYSKFTLPQANGARAQVSFAKLREPHWLPGRSPADLRA